MLGRDLRQGLFEGGPRLGPFLLAQQGVPRFEVGLDRRGLGAASAGLLLGDRRSVMRSGGGGPPDSRTSAGPSAVTKPSASITAVQAPPARPSTAQRPLWSVVIGGGPADGSLPQRSVILAPAIG